MNNRKQISICGIGPGNPDYVSSAVYSEVDRADLLIGGKRQLSTFTEFCKKSCLFDGKVDDLKKNIEKYGNKYIVVLVSGDAGFYSLRRFIMETFSNAEIKIFPGISTYQYFYAKLGFGYENAFLASLHGIQMDYLEKLKVHSSLFLLTSRENNYKNIAKNLLVNGFGNLIMHIGINLSYPDEKIISLKASKAVRLTDEFLLCSIIIENPYAE